MAVLSVVVLLGALVGAYQAGRAGTTMEAQAQPVATPAPTPSLPATKVPVWQKMGPWLMECRIKTADVTCLVPGPACDAARAAITGDGIFTRLKGAGERLDWLDVVADVDEALATCKAGLGEEYQRKVTR